MEMDGGGIVRERGGAESGSTCTVETGESVAAVLRLKVTDLAVDMEGGAAVTITGSAGQKKTNPTIYSLSSTKRHILETSMLLCEAHLCNFC